MNTANINKVMTTAVVGVAALLFAGVASAEIKIATIRATELVAQSPQFKAGADKMKAEFDRRKSDLEAEGKKFQDDVKKYQKEGDAMSSADRAKTEKDLQSRQVDLQYKQRQFQEDLQNRDRQLTADMTSKIKTVIETVAKEKGIDLVVQDPVYASPAVDITTEVLKKLQAAK
jgi:Skp family chaperone for outer membrane proteins